MTRLQLQIKLTIAIILITLSCSKDKQIEPIKINTKYDLISFHLQSIDNGLLYLNDSLLYEGNYGAIAISLAQKDSVRFKAYGNNATLIIKRNDTTQQTSKWSIGYVSSIYHNN